MLEAGWPRWCLAGATGLCWVHSGTSLRLCWVELAVWKCWKFVYKHSVCAEEVGGSAWLLCELLHELLLWPPPMLALASWACCLLFLGHSCVIDFVSLVYDLIA